MNDAELSALLEGCCLGKDGAWNEFIERFHPLIRGTVKRICNSNVEDVIQQVYERLLKSNYLLLRRFNGPFGGFLLYLKRIARNVALEHARSRDGRLDNVASLDDVLERMTDRKNEPEPMFLEVETFARLESAIATLRPSYREVVMFLYRGWTHGQIAKALKVPVGTVLTHADRAKKILRNQLKVEIK